MEWNGEEERHLFARTEMIKGAKPATLLPHFQMFVMELIFFFLPSVICSLFQSDTWINKHVRQVDDQVYENITNRNHNRKPLNNGEVTRSYGFK